MILEMVSYRPEMLAKLDIGLKEEDAQLEPAPVEGGGFKPEPEEEYLSKIIENFNEHFGDIDWSDKDSVQKVITEELPAKVAADTAYQNAIKNSDKQNARIEHDRALERAVFGLLTTQTEFFKQFSDNPNFQKWLGNEIFNATYIPPEQSGSGLRV